MLPIFDKRCEHVNVMLAALAAVYFRRGRRARNRRQVYPMDQILIENGTLSGPWRQPRNLHQEVTGSIHNDSVAKPLGFRGGTVAGNIHHEQFGPLALKAFGQRWFERGGLSLFYLNASTDAEQVKAFMRAPANDGDDAQVEAWMDPESGARVLEGTAWVGNPAEPSALWRRFEARKDTGQEVRILAGIGPGYELPEVRARITAERQADRRKVITEPLDSYWGESPWGGAICTPTTAFELLDVPIHALAGRIGSAVGLYGAIEVRVLNGPLFVEKEYLARGRVLDVGASPKAENLWREGWLRDPDTGQDVAQLLMLNRWMKASSDRYPELQGG